MSIIRKYTNYLTKYLVDKDMDMVLSVNIIVYLSICENFTILASLCS